MGIVSGQDNSLASFSFITPTAHTTLVTSTVPAAANVASIKSHIPIFLNMKAANYTMWSVFFKVLCGKFHLLHHIDGSIPATPTDPTWAQEDYIVLSWLFGCIHEAVLTVTVEPTHTARDLWLCVEGHFRNNYETCAIYLHHQFHSIMKGDLSITEYS
ncbi:uncharacterized protein LOC133906076 [Phragmites australis]|uniref:uncharacterized protein LOC133906076 n=1 Tax=Phragmites australis TaxID=29695 RepID=UPI002D77C8A4|nr:uncharacterized protein LOC133906076 [Phragmites australis]